MRACVRARARNINVNFQILSTAIPQKPQPVYIIELEMLFAFSFCINTTVLFIKNIFQTRFSPQVHVEQVRDLLCSQREMLVSSSFMRSLSGFAKASMIQSKGR